MNVLQKCPFRGANSVEFSIFKVILFHFNDISPLTDSGRTLPALQSGEHPTSKPLNAAINFKKGVFQQSTEDWDWLYSLLHFDAFCTPLCKHHYFVFSILSPNSGPPKDLLFSVHGISQPHDCKGKHKICLKQNNGLRRAKSSKTWPPRCAHNCPSAEIFIVSPAWCRVPPIFPTETSWNEVFWDLGNFPPERNRHVRHVSLFL